MSKKDQLYKVVHTTLINGKFLYAGKIVQPKEVEEAAQEDFARAVEAGSIVKYDTPKTKKAAKEEIFGDDEGDDDEPTDEGDDEDIPEDLDDEEDEPEDESEDDAEGDDLEDEAETTLEDLEGIGKATANKLRAIGIETPAALKERIAEAGVKAILALNYERVQNGLAALEEDGE